MSNSKEEIREAVLAKTERELLALAEDYSHRVTMRDYDNGASYDHYVEATPEQAKAISGIIYGALLAIRGGYDIQTVKNTAEYIGAELLNRYFGDSYEKDDSLFAPHINCYDTIYVPIVKIVNLLTQERCA